MKKSQILFAGIALVIVGYASHGIYTSIEEKKFVEIFNIPYPRTVEQKLLNLSLIDHIVDQKWQKVGASLRELEMLQERVNHLPILSQKDLGYEKYEEQRSEQRRTIEQYQGVLNGYKIAQREHADAYESAHDAGFMEGPEKRLLKQENHLVFEKR